MSSDDLTGSSNAAKAAGPAAPADIEVYFNLVDEPWIRCLNLDGTVEALGIRDVFRRSRQIRRLTNEIPTQDFSILRLLLAILWRGTVVDPEQTALDDPLPVSWWRELLSRDGLLTDSVASYLDEVHDRFWLRHPSQPFLQVADLATEKGGRSEVRRLVVDAENDYFSMRAGRGASSLSYSDAARWLLHLQAYDYSGIKSGAIGDPRVTGGKGYPIGTGWAGATGGVVMHGSNLHETLLLNTPAGLIHELWEAEGRAEEGLQPADRPAWERPASTAAPRVSDAPDGPVDLLTWQSRRVRLFFDGDCVDGVLVSNGDRIDPVNRFEDPLTGHRYSRNKSKAGKTVYFPQTHDVSEPVWRGIQPLLAKYDIHVPRVNGEQDPAKRPRPPRTISELARYSEGTLGLGGPVTVQMVGVEYGAQQAVVTNTVNAELEMNIAVLAADGDLLRGLVTDAAVRTHEVARAITYYAGLLAQAQAPGMARAQIPDRTDAGQRYLAIVEPAFRHWLRGLDIGVEAGKVESAWRAQGRAAAVRLIDDLAAEAGPVAVMGWLEEDQLRSTASAQRWVRRRLGELFPWDAAEENQSTGVGAAVERPSASQERRQES